MPSNDKDSYGSRKDGTPSRLVLMFIIILGNHLIHDVVSDWTEKYFKPAAAIEHIVGDENLIFIRKKPLLNSKDLPM
jgi:hypothetical protein